MIPNFKLYFAESVLQRLNVQSPVVPPALIISNSAFCICGFGMVLSVNSDYFLKQRQKLMFVMVKCGFSFEVRTVFLNDI
jgi:hypothetical protein